MLFDPVIVSAATLSLVLSLVLWAVVSDVRRLQIPNWIPIAIAVLFAAPAVMGAGVGDWVSALALAGLVLTAGFGLFFAGVLGAGDVKLLAAVSLWTGTEGVLALLVGTALAGGVLAGGICLAQRFSIAGPTFIAKGQVPYALAIACGTAFAFTHVGLIAV